MKVSDKNIETSVSRVFGLLKEAHKSNPYALQILTIDEVKDLCFAYCCVLQNEEEIAPLLAECRELME